MISAVIVNLNQGEKIEKCLESIKDFAEEIIVVDLGSTDNSPQIYQKFKVRVFQHDPVSYVEKIRNFAVSKTSGDWILVLDPDEVLNESLKNKLKEIAAQGEYEVVNIPRKNIFFGRPISHSNWWPDKHVRFFKKGRVLWSDKIHEYPKAEGRVFDLPAKEEFAILHYGYTSVSEFLERQNRYSEVEAGNLFSKGVRFSWFNFFWKPTREFLVRFIRHAGFLDGFYGFALTVLMMIYQVSVMIKLWEMEKKK